MLQTFSLPLQQSVLAEYGGWAGLRREAAQMGCDGVEGIWCGEDIPPVLQRGGAAADLMQGYHLTFFPDWLDFYREDKAAIIDKFGSLAAAENFYGGWGAEVLLNFYRADLARAEQLAAKYLVFHVSDVSVAEGYTYRWLHSNLEVIDAAVEVINRLLAAYPEEPWEFLVENQWWPGFTFTEPAQTERLLAGINYSRKGIMLDVGHLLNCNWQLTSQAEGAAYVQAMLRRHGQLARAVRGVHLHYSLSGQYARAHTGRLPDFWPQDYGRQFDLSYSHVLQIDQHLPWTDKAILPVLARIAPAYLTHELNVDGRAQRRRRVSRQSRLIEPIK